jgi:hypothetical protein
MIVLKTVQLHIFTPVSIALNVFLGLYTGHIFVA